MSVAPPRSAVRLLAWVLAGDPAAPAITGDLLEDFVRQQRRRGRAAAARWYWREVLSLAARRAIPSSTKGRTMHPASLRRSREPVRFVRTTLGRFIRRAGRRPVYPLLAVSLTMLPVAAATAVTTLTWAALFRPLPYPEPDRLVSLTAPVRTESGEIVDTQLSRLLLARWRESARGLEGIAGYELADMNLTGAGEPRPVHGARISSNLHEVLGVRPARGRAFVAAEEIAAGDVAIVTRALERELFGGADATGRALVLDGRPRTVVGVLDDGFTLLYNDVQVLIPLPLEPAMLAHDRNRLTVGIGRLRRGVGAPAAMEELDGMVRTIATEFPQQYASTTVDVRALDTVVRGERAPVLLALLGATGVMLLIAGLNLANLSLAEATAGRGEAATRLALGESRARLIATQGVESIAITLFGAPVGIMLGVGVLSVIQRAFPGAVQGLPPLDVAGPVPLALGTGVALLTAALMVPASVHALRIRTTSVASMGGRTLNQRADVRMRELLLCVQVSLSFVLLAATAVLGRSLAELLSMDVGFATDGLHAIEMQIPNSVYPGEQDRAGYVRRLIDALAAVPGVEGAASTQTRFVHNENNLTFFDLENQPLDDSEQRIASLRHVSHELADVMGLRVRRGRFLSPQDDANAPMAVVVSESFVRTYYPDRDPLGQRIRRGTNNTTNPWMTVVGVVEDVRDAGLDVDLGPTLYIAYAQRNTPTARATLVVRSQLPAAALARPLRRAVWSVDPAQGIQRITPVSALLRTMTAQPRLQALVVSSFGGLAFILVLAGVNALAIYGMLLRRREVALRAALGASPRTVMAFALRRALLPVLGGVLLGAPFVLIVVRALGGSATDHATLLAGAALAMIGGSALASSSPVVRLVRMPAAAVLRE